jgi:hypothetical protein
MNEVVLGFDRRIRSSDISCGYWSNERRSQYLIRMDVLYPLSVDCAVWPRLDEPDLDGSIYSKSYSPLSSSVEELVSSSRLQDGVAIAISVVEPYADNSFYNLMLHAGKTFPLKIAAGWRLFGFDVADEGLISGLTNCGYEESSVNDIRGRWKDQLNDNHLFDSISAAKEFVAYSDFRVPEHAPFYVYGLYKIEAA